jgi:peptidoglycan/xylan/chitin deacetylase (PgdA/CDA1 family)
MNRILSMVLYFFCGVALADTTCTGSDIVDRAYNSGCTSQQLQPVPFVPVLMYHQFTDKTTRESLPIEKFRQQVEWLHQEGFTTITISQLADAMEGHTPMPNKAVAITMDDGWSSALQAADILRAANMAATFYIISGVFERSEYMSKSQVKALSDNPRFEIGAHSHTHLMEWINDLSKLDTRIAVGEMLMSKRIVEDVIQKPVRSYAWPFGYVRPEMIPFTGTAGLTSTVHVNSESKNVKGMSASDIRRVNIDGRCTLEQFKNMVTTGRLERCNDEANGLGQKVIP